MSKMEKTLTYIYLSFLFITLVVIIYALAHPRPAPPKTVEETINTEVLDEIITVIEMLSYDLELLEERTLVLEQLKRSNEKTPPINE